MQAHSPGMHFARRTIAERPLTRLPEAGIRNVYYKSDTTLPYKSPPSTRSRNEYLAGSYDGNIATENGLLFNIDWMKGQKTGFFVDQRENRRLLGEPRRWPESTQHVLLYGRILRLCHAWRSAERGLCGLLVEGGRPDRRQHSPEFSLTIPVTIPTTWTHSDSSVKCPPTPTI